MALESGVSFLIKNRLPSKWTPNGLGWQETLTAKYAGFYASCMAATDIMGLSTSAHQDILFDLFYNHLLCIVDNDFVPANTELQSSLMAVRKECLSTTTRVAHFIIASGVYKNNISADKIAAKFACRLSEDINRHGACPYVVGDIASRIDIAPTVQAAIALSFFSTTYLFEIKKCLAYIFEQLCDSRSSLVVKIVCSWAISMLSGYGSEEQILGATDFIKSLSRSTISPSLRYEIKFYQTAIERHDYYNYNCHILFMHTLFNLISMNRIDTSVPTYLLDIDAICEQFIKWGYYKTGESFQYWENHQALTLLQRFNAIHKNKEESFMLVSPRHFTNHSFVTEDDLAVVLMPFGPDWADDVYGTFHATISAAGYRYWRSDELHGDDMITQTIWEHINKAKFIIADCTGKNPNVFYELGIAHTIGKPVFICAQNKKDIPFDLSGIRRVVYNKPLPSNLHKLSDQLAKFIKQL